MVVGAGSTTSYATKVFAKKMHAKSVVMMLPRGYRYDFDIIFAQIHDNPPKQENIIEIPANFSYVEPKGYLPSRKKVYRNRDRWRQQDVYDVKREASGTT